MNKPIAAHAWEREKHEHYVEPFWCSERLFSEEKFEGEIQDPCCGFGRIVESAKKTGLTAYGTDIVDRGYRDIVHMHDFLLQGDLLAPNIVGNPPFLLVKEFALHALDLGADKVALIFPTARLNAARWLEQTPLARIWLMTPRPSMPPGRTITAGQKPGGGKMDFCWLVWSHRHVGPSEIRWLHRDIGQPPSVPFDPPDTSDRPFGVTP